MAVSIKELIKQKEDIEKRKKQLFDIETSIGIITIKQPSVTLVAEVKSLEEANDAYFILNSVVEPNLKDKELQAAYDCNEPTDIVDKLFQPGEIPVISEEILRCAGFRKNIKAVLHEAAKN